MSRIHRTLSAAATITAPLALLTGWVLLMARAGQPPDAQWSLAHSLQLVGVVLFIPTVAYLKHLIGDQGSPWPALAAALVLLGAVALAGQFAIDLAAGQLSTSQAEMSALFSQLSAAPIIRLPFYLIGPMLFYAGLIILLSLLTARHLVPRGSGVLAIAGIAAVGTGSFTNSASITLAGFAAFSLAFAIIGVQSLSKPSAAPKGAA